MQDVPHVHDTLSNNQVHPQKRWSGQIQTRNYRLTRTQGTDTKFTLVERRTLGEFEFDHAYVGTEMGRGDVVQFYVGDVDLEDSVPHSSLTCVGGVYQHDLSETMLDAVEHIEEYGHLPRPDTVIEPRAACSLEQTGGDGE